MVDEVSVAKSIRRWWRQPDSFAWISYYFRARGMLTVSRVLIASIVLSLCLPGTVLMFSPSGPEGTWPRALAWVAIACAATCGVLFLARWPTKRQSIGFILVINLCIAVVCQVQADPMVGLIGCAAFALTGGYIACFHSAGYMVYNFTVAIYLSMLQAGRYGFDGDPALVLAALSLVLPLIVGVPFGIQAVVHVLGLDLLRARHDPLTGLLNRRAFFDHVEELMIANRNRPCYLTMVMADLDRFKRLNDTSGHVVGDQALVAVGDALTMIGRDGAVTGRVGGEEFLVAAVLGVPAPAPLAQRVCDAVAALPFPITASVGTAVGRIDGLSERAQLELMRHLHTQADSAMYEAKRAGGNQVRHA